MTTNDERDLPLFEAASASEAFRARLRDQFVSGRIADGAGHDSADADALRPVLREEPADAAFAARLGAARAAFEDGAAVVGWVAAIAPALIAVPVIRLGIFLFAKAPGARCVTPVASPWRVIVVGLCCALVLVLGVAPELVWSRYLQGLLTE